MKKRRLWSAVLATGMLFSAYGCGEETETPQKSDNTVKIETSANQYKATVNSLVSTDALGRSFGEALVTDAENQVGLFYWIWHEEKSGIYNISELLESNPSALWGTGSASQTVSPLNQTHYWGEPLYGYYDSSDPWVIRRHLELFTMSGIDYLILDQTNYVLYPEATEALLNEVLYFQQQGWDCPKIAVMFGYTSYSNSCVGEFYLKYYKNEKYSSCWYKKDGKPMISVDLADTGVGSEYGTENSEYTFEEWLAYTMVLHNKVSSETEAKAVAREMMNFFTFRNTLWPYQHNDEKDDNVEKDDYSWIDWVYPQHITSDGYVNVSVAQHPAYAMSASEHPAFSATHYNKNWGRGWDYVSGTNDIDRVAQGYNLENQWKTVHKNKGKVNEVMITGWNEWTAAKLTDYYTQEYGGYVCFADNFNYEFSRDSEMMVGGYGDNYYLQNMRNTRAFKNDKKVRFYAATSSPTLNSEKGWAGRTYMDLAGDAMERNFRNTVAEGRPHAAVYTNTTNRNDIVSTQVVNDGKYLYIKINTLNDIVVDETANNNLNILLSVQGNTGASWEGYQYLVNRQAPQNGAGITSVEKVAVNGKYEWIGAGNAETYLSGKTFAIKIPLATLGIKDASSFTVDFKVADGISDPSDMMKYYVDGDSAPIGRLNYRYNAGK
ncbi:MAG: hypothetical protein E7380_04465 [Clostridiales bacterium]|nr:hypothetical protein [Clostridiales bacterium]